MMKAKGNKKKSTQQSYVENCIMNIMEIVYSIVFVASFSFDRKTEDVKRTKELLMYFYLERIIFLSYY